MASPGFKRYATVDPAKKQFAPLYRVAEAIFEDIERMSGAAPSAPVHITDHQLDSLRLLFDKQLPKALKIIEGDRIVCYVGSISGRKVFRVKGDKTIHTVFPGHYCTCSSFQFDVVKSQDALQCKHQLAARLAALLHQCRVESVDERTIIEMLDDPFRT